MPRTDDDSWDLASSVGATATMVATSRALASQGPEPLLDDPFADPLVRAVGLAPFVRILDGDLSLEDRPDAEPQDAHRANDRAHKVFRRLLHRRHRSGRAAGSDPGVGLGHPGLPAAVAGRDGRLRDRPAPGDRIQNQHAGRPRRHPDRGTPHDRHRSARRLAGRVAGRRFRRRPADRVERRGAVALPAVRCPGPTVRQHHRAQRTGQPAGHRAHPRPGRLLRRTRAAASASGGNASVSTSTRPISSIMANATSWPTTSPSTAGRWTPILPQSYTRAMDFTSRTTRRWRCSGR